jgi:hypothetical protein
MQTNELQALKASGILSNAAYIRMQLQATKPADSASFYTISIKQDFPGSTAAEVFNELANLTRDGKIEGSIPTSFTVTHQDPSLLTSYSPEQVRQLRGQSMFRQKGYLFFCLGADNPGKTSTQLVDPLRITQFYGLSMTDFFGELGRLTGDRTITTDIDRISIRWIAYTASVLQSDSSTVAIELERIKTSLERLLAEHIQATDPHPNYATDTDVLRLSSSLTEAVANFSKELDAIATEVNDKQIKGEYVTSYQLSELTRNILAAIDSKQPLGNYALQSRLDQAVANFSRELDALTTARSISTASFNEAIASLQAQITANSAADTAAISTAITNLQQGIDSRNYVVNQTLSDTVSTLQARITAGDSTQASTLQAAVSMLQAAIDGKQATGDYVPTSTLRSVIVSLQTAIDSKQISGDYATSAAVTTAIGNLQKAIDSKNYVMSDAFNTAIASLQTAINGKQAAGDYASSQALSSAVQSLQNAIALKQPAGDYAAAIHNHTIAAITGLQAVLDSKQAAGNYALSSAVADAIISLQNAINTKQPTGNYALSTDLAAYQPKGDYPLRSEIVIPKVTRSLYNQDAPTTPSLGDVWEAYNNSGDTFDTERWTFNGNYWVSQRRIANWSFNALSAASNFFELLDKYPQKHGVLFEWFTIGLKAGSSNSASAYATFTLSRRDSSGNSTALSSFTTSATAASGRLYSMKDIKVSFPFDQAIDAVIALTLTGTPGAMSGSASFSYRYAW